MTVRERLGRACPLTPDACDIAVLPIPRDKGIAGMYEVLGLEPVTDAGGRLPAQTVPFAAAVQHRGERLDDLSHGRHVVGRPRAWLRPVAGDPSGCRTCRTGASPRPAAHSADVGRSPEAQVAVVAVRAHTSPYRTSVRPQRGSVGDLDMLVCR